MPKVKASKTSYFVVGGAALLVFLVIGLGREYVGNLQIKYEIRQQEKERELLTAQHLETLDLIDSLSNEYFLEREGRLKQGLVKPGEEVLIIDSGERNGEKEEVKYGIESTEELSNPELWLYFFFDREKFEYLKVL